MEKVEKVKYPRFKEEEKLNVVFLQKDIEKLIKLRKEGCSYLKLAKIFKASYYATRNQCLKKLDFKKYREEADMRNKKSEELYYSKYKGSEQLAKNRKRFNQRAKQKIGFKEFDAMTSRKYRNKLKKPTTSV